MPSINQAQLRALLQRAAGLAQRGARHEARDLLESLLKTAPRNPNVLRQLAVLSADLGDHPRAIDLYRRALRAAPGQQSLLLRLALSLRATGRENEALGILAQAAKTSDNPATLLMQIADIHDHAGRMEEAREALDEAIERHEENLEPRIMLAAFDAREGQYDQAIDELREIIEEEPAPQVLARAHHELGSALDRTGEYAEAWNAFTRSKRLIEQLNPQAKIRDRYLFSITETFKSTLTSDVLTAWGSCSYQDELPRVGHLLGFPRTGTTLTEMVLASHPEIVTLEERDCLDSVARMERMSVDNLDGLDEERIKTLRLRYLGALRRELGDRMDSANLVIDKGPLHTPLLGFITRLLPESSVVFALRDPRDIMVSCYTQLLTRSWFLSIDGTAELYATLMGFWLHVRDMVPLSWIEVRYEDTVEDLEGQSRRLLEKLGMPWDERVLSFHETAGERYVATPSFEAVRKPISGESVARWKNYEQQLEPVLDTLQPYIDAFGYTS
ncbi:MAG: sulfotransferase [Planctomycetota bacterium]